MWSRLPNDIINEVANRLEAVEDFLAFSSVCKSWQSVYRNKTWHPSPQIPWLMLDTNQDGEHCFSFYRNKTMKIPFPKTRDRRIWGSSYGWLIIIDQDLDIQLRNPITRIKLDLPSVSTFDNPDYVKVDWFNLVHKASVLKLGTEFLATVIYGPKNSLAFARFGETTWTTVKSRLIFVSVTCYKGKILGLSINGTLAIIDINEQKPPTVGGFVSPPVGERSWEHIFLSETSEDLLLVIQHSRKMIVYRFDMVSWEWKKMESLGDRVLFLDGHNCISVSLHVTTLYLKTDCIYYSHDGSNKKYIHVYDVKNDISKTISLAGVVYGARFRCPGWLIPSLQ